MFEAKLFRTKEWVDAGEKPEPKTLYPRIDSEKALRKKLPVVTEFEQYVFHRGADEKDSIPVREEMLKLDEMKLFDRIAVYESSDGNAALVVGEKDEAFFKIAFMGDEAYLNQTEKAPSKIGLSDIALGGVIAAVIVAIIFMSEYFSAPDSAGRSLMDGQKPVMISSAGQAELQPKPDPEYFVTNLVTEKTIPLLELFSDIRRIEREKQRMGIVRIYLNDGTAWDARISRRYFQTGTSIVTKVYLYDTWVKVERDF